MCSLVGSQGQLPRSRGRGKRNLGPMRGVGAPDSLPGSVRYREANFRSLCGTGQYKLPRGTSADGSTAETSR